MPDSDRKRAALADFLGEDQEDIFTVTYDASLFEVGSREYLVLTDEEADKRATTDAGESLWAFSASFWGRYTSLPQSTIAAVAKIQGTLCEDFGPVLAAILGNRLDEMLADAVAEDGRGHFLASYDGEENEVGTGDNTLYIYRVN